MKKVLFFLVFFTVVTPLFSQMVTTYEGELGTTVAYNVASFSDVRDKTLEDVLNKMPGVSTSSRAGSGAVRTISYNGMGVGKIFVDGTDLRSSFNMVAGIKPEEIERVEFVENFQAVKVLRNKQYSSIAALNIVMKEGSGADWSGTAKLGVGAPSFLVDGDIYALRIAGKSQSMVNLKANNTGLDLNSAISSFSADNIGISVDLFGLSNYIDLNPSTSPLAVERKRFNQSYMFNTVNTVKLSENFELFSQLSYLYDKTKSENSQETTYFMNDGSTIEENSGELATAIDQQLKLNLALISNNDDYYLVNHIFARAIWDKTNMDLTGSYPNGQIGEIKSINAKNDFRYLRPIGDWTLTVFSQNQFMANPQNLIVNRIGSEQQQDITSKAVFTDTKLSFGYTAGKWTVSLVGALDAVNRDLNTGLLGINDFETSDNESNFGYFNTYIQPTANYVSNKLQFQLGMPVKFYHYWFEDQIRGDESKKNITNFEPSFSLRYQISKLLSMTLNGLIEYDEVDAGSFYTGMILTNYRRVREGALKYDLDGERTLGLAYSFVKPEHSFFLSGRVGYSEGKSMYRSFDTFVGDYVLVGSIPQKTDTKNFSTSVDINKGITALKGTVGLWVGYTNSEQTRIRNNEEVLYNTQVIAVEPNITGRIAKWAQVNYDFSLWNTIMKISNVDTKSKSNRYNQTLEFILTPTDNLNFSVLGEHYHTIITGGQAKNLVLTDVKAEYQITPKWQLIASVTNILNQKDYSYTVISNLTSTHTSYSIRPRNFLLSVYYKF